MQVCGMIVFFVHYVSKKHRIPFNEYFLDRDVMDCLSYFHKEILKQDLLPVYGMNTSNVIL